MSLIVLRFYSGPTLIYLYEITICTRSPPSYLPNAYCSFGSTCSCGGVRGGDLPFGDAEGEPEDGEEAADHHGEEVAHYPLEYRG